MAVRPGSLGTRNSAAAACTPRPPWSCHIGTGRRADPTVRGLTPSGSRRAGSPSTPPSRGRACTRTVWSSVCRLARVWDPNRSSRGAVPRVLAEDVGHLHATPETPVGAPPSPSLSLVPFAGTTFAIPVGRAWAHPTRVAYARPCRAATPQRPRADRRDRLLGGWTPGASPARPCRATSASAARGPCCRASVEDVIELQPEYVFSRHLPRTSAVVAGAPHLLLHDSAEGSRCGRGRSPLDRRAREQQSQPGLARRLRRQVELVRRVAWNGGHRADRADSGLDRDNRRSRVVARAILRILVRRPLEPRLDV